ncbi:leucine-rich receptor-like protein kinase family protein [Actinidia rufa]|uniref:Leucine-rich receptor-like protein kinase family protein n=1 Tax=Actinidia rufa TaxID=165716 RepID=A0A7J0E2C5_9ERIC|nr:leucine-rich receptor-like protein kinase family protein [Actinidia rufa]
MNLPHSLSLLLVSLLLVSSSQDEVRSLLEFKKGIREDPLGKVRDSWSDSSSDPSACRRSFYGVVCDPDTGNVTAIVLDRLGLVGDLKFSTLIGLTNLKNLSLSGNSLTGRLVPSLGSMYTLQHLDLSGNQFYGPIPARITDLWGLNYLNLSSNNFNGGFPSGIWKLQQLKVLDLHSNRLLGDIQDLLTELRNVEHVELSYNLFSGSLAMDAQNISSLANTVQYLNLSHNSLSGGFFHDDVIPLFRNLQVLDLGDNQLSGELPAFASLPNLRVLRLGSNGFFGSIPEELLESLIPLEELDLSGNGFSDRIHEINSTRLSVLNLSSNALSGSLPSSVGRCLIVDLSRNMLSGDVSAMQSWEASLEILDLSSNKFSGSIPNLTSLFHSLTTFSVKNNSLEGILPPVLGSYERLSAIDLSLNKFDGSIPPSFFTSMTLTNLNLSGNQFVGSIPLHGSQSGELLVLPSYPPMESLDLSENILTGTLPSDIGKLGGLKLLNLAKNHLSGQIPNELNKLSGLESCPRKLENFPITSFHPGNSLLIFPNGMPSHGDNPVENHGEGKHHTSKLSIRVAIIVASVGAVMMIAFVLFAYHRAQRRDFRIRSGFSAQTAGSDANLGRFSKPSLFRFHKNVEPPPISFSFSNDHLLTSNSRSLSAQTESGTEIVEFVLPEGGAGTSASLSPSVPDNRPVISGRKSSPDSPVSSSPRFVDAIEQSVTLDVNSPDRLAGELFFLDASLGFTAEELSRAPAEVLGRSSHGTLYKATLDSGHVLNVKWLRVGLVKHKKEFAKEVKKIGSMRHPGIVPLRAYYWGPREQERLLLADYVQGDSLGLHLYETTPRRYSRLSFSQRLKVAVEVAQCPDLNVRLTDYGLHRLMTPAGIAEQILNLGALGYRAPELATAAKPIPSFKADVYAFGVILMELLTRRSAGDIISGQSGAVDLTDWVRLCDEEGRGMDCIDRDIAPGEEEHSGAMYELLAISLRTRQCLLVPYHSSSNAVLDPSYGELMAFTSLHNLYLLFSLFLIFRFSTLKLVTGSKPVVSSYIVHTDAEARPSPFSTQDDWFVSLYPGKISTNSFPLVYLENCGSAITLPDHIMGKIVICTSTKSEAVKNGHLVQASGGVGLIQLNHVFEGEGLVAISYTLPSATVGYKEAMELLSYINTTKNPIASFRIHNLTVVGKERAPIVLSFSARGPNPVVPEVLKPNIIGPGLNILAAWPPNIPPSRSPYDPRRVNFNTDSGTSMAVPHVAGVAALLRAAHPNWSPAAIRSALMTTSATMDSQDRPIISYEDMEPATPISVGSGHVNPQLATDPGLIYDADISDYTKFLCSLNYTKEQMKVFVDGPSTCSSYFSSPGDLNYPSFSVVFKPKNYVIELKRTVTNVAEVLPERYKVRIVIARAEKFTVSVEPRDLIFERSYEKQSYRVKFKSNYLFDNSSSIVEQMVFGSISWESDRHIVRSPFTVMWNKS